MKSIPAGTALRITLGRLLRPVVRFSSKLLSASTAPGPDGDELLSTSRLNACVPAVDVQLIVHCPEVPLPPPGVHACRTPVVLESIQRVAYVVAGDTYAGLRAPAAVPLVAGIPIFRVPVATCCDEAGKADVGAEPVPPPPEHAERARDRATSGAAYLTVNMNPLSVV